MNKYPEHLVFGLDIGTRSIVGIVGYKDRVNHFNVIAMVSKEHETRAMLDGQIHDIASVAETIVLIKNQLEKEIGRKLEEVCIAAAGRVLQTVTVQADYELNYETIVDAEQIHTLELKAIERAYELVREQTKDVKDNFYCVGYTVVKYYLNDYAILSLEGHKANKISTELIATFLPEEVIDGLYRAIEIAGLSVVNLTLEPIAAINVAIPEKFRLLNLALVDVGAGTSDICITKDGSIIGYGMIPFAGDEITEMVAKKYLVDFATAEKIKLACLRKKSISYKDVLGMKHSLTTAEVLEEVKEVVEIITKNVAEKIMELNGDKSVAAVFLVGGGGKISNFAPSLAEYLHIQKERVALRGSEVLQEVDFLQPNIKKDSLLVTPIGICLNYYEQKNNFVNVILNGERVKLYDNSKLTIVDAGMQLGFPYEDLFPKRGQALHFTVDGMKRMVRGELGEAAEIKQNGKIVGMNSAIVQNDIIDITKSTAGSDAVYEVRQLPEFHKSIDFIVNDKKVTCPRFVMVNKNLVSEFYNIKQNDDIRILNYYTLEQVLEVMDIAYNPSILVNHMTAQPDEKVYENFQIVCDFSVEESEYINENLENKNFENKNVNNKVNNNVNNKLNTNLSPKVTTMNSVKLAENKTEEALIHITVNGGPITLKKKAKYILVDVLDFYPFDLSVVKGIRLVTQINGESAEFSDPIQEGDIVDIFWKQ